MRNEGRIAIVHILLASFLYTGTLDSTANAQRDKAVQATELLERAVESSFSPHTATAAFRLTATLQIPLPNGKTGKGTYSLAWESSIRWREEISLSGYSRLRVGGDGKFWQLRNTDFELFPIYELAKVLKLARQLDTDRLGIVKKVKKRTWKSISIRCVEWEFSYERKSELCFDLASGGLVRKKSGPETTEYTGYTAFQDKVFPGTIRRTTLGRTVIKLEVIELREEPTLDPLLFIPPVSARAWPWCEEPEQAEFAYYVPADYPTSARIARIQGEVAIYGIVGIDGSIRNLRIVQPTGTVLDSSVFAAALLWRFRPATCNGAPIETEVVVATTFQIGS